MARTKHNDKRLRLVEAADHLILKNGFNITTLADIAKEADVPLGNVYYYFKTKYSILEAVISHRLQLFKEQTEAWTSLPSPKERLTALLEDYITKKEHTARFGCALGSLCQELGKLGSQIGNHSAKLMQEWVRYIEKQFIELHHPTPLLAAEHLVASLQGASLMTLTLKDPALLQRQATQLAREIDQQFLLVKAA